MKKISSLFVKGISILPALLVMPAMAYDRIVLNSDEQYADGFVLSDVTFTGNGAGMQVNGNGSHIVFLGTAYFSGNTEYRQGEDQNTGLGGAIFVNNPVGMNQIDFNGTVEFDGNHADTAGGAIYNEGVITFKDTASFINNTSASGGAITTHQGATTIFKKAAMFEDNSTVALANKGTTVFEDTANFKHNSVANGGENGVLKFQKGLTVDGSTNTGLSNGALLSVSGGDITIKNNSADRYSGLYSSSYQEVPNGPILSHAQTYLGATVNGDVVTVDPTVNLIYFFNNTATGSSAGALGVHEQSETTQLYAKNIKFEENTSAGDYGGAIFNAGELKILGDKNEFVENVSNNTNATKSGGGAIHNRGIGINGHIADLVIGKNTSINLFEENISKTHGGAIAARSVDGEHQDSSVIINGTTTFNSNQATVNGGAIWNHVAEKSGTTGNADLVFNGATTFNSNKSLNGLGGALYNTGTTTFNGNATFSGNTDSTGANDIYNDGTVNIASGTTTIGGGITGNGTLNIASGSTLNIGTASVTQGAIDLDGTMLATLRSGDNAQITAGTFTGDGVLKLSFDNVGTYKVFGDANFDNIEVENPIYDLSWNNGTVTTVAKSGESIAAANEGISTDTGKMISALANSNDSTASQMSVTIQESLANGDADYVEHEVSKMNPEKAPVITSVALSIQNQVLAAAGERMALPLTGRSGGDIKADLGVWAKGMYNYTKHKDTFTGNTWGGSVGIDTDLNHSVILGAGYSFGITNVDMNSHDADINSNTVFVYGQYRNSDWFVNGTIAYTMSEYDWNKTVFGVHTDPSYKVNSLSEQIMGGYHFANGITPTLGLRYLDVHQDAYKDGIVSVNDIYSKYLTGVVGMDFKNAWVAPHSSIFWNPELHLAATYDMISDSDVALVMVPGAAAYTLEADSLSRLGGEFGIGLTAEYYYLTVSLNYDLNIHKDFSSQTGSLKVKYKF